MRVVEWNWKRVSVNEVGERKNEMVMDGNECIENIDAIENEKQRCVVMNVKELK